MKKTTKKNQLFVGSDHDGFYLKESLKPYLEKLGVEVSDLGNDRYDGADDYPDFAALVAREVSKGRGRGLLLCNSGVGMEIAANKFTGVRAVNAPTKVLATSSRHDDDTNILCLPAGYLSLSQAKIIVAAWLKTPFGKAPRYRRRIQKIRKLERTRG